MVIEHVLNAEISWQSQWWGDNSAPGAKQKRVYSYTISPVQAKAAPNMIRSYLFNFYRRISGEAVFFVLPFAFGYGVYTWGNKEYAYVNSKAAHAHGEHH
ncbi:ubiquinol-cytochrome c reductase complex ubiquinone-binding protein qp-c [Moniliophthora roreri MCA 2997]|uniref:Cytochrome b-c1 complex subunit 8 n=2 Tax=Moniliophthora roreri TaxID=221103 RepID=V2WUJ6_MONRO|nr:ubiquinol-cytochrome c reductase complex ubiquinone-binding protein qp-c [Moniliophthora roreri MCA 2997]